jgi:hypothetical protein
MQLDLEKYENRRVEEMRMQEPRTFGQACEVNLGAA